MSHIEKRQNSCGDGDSGGTSIAKKAKLSSDGIVNSDVGPSLSRSTVVDFFKMLSQEEHRHVLSFLTSVCSDKLNTTKTLDSQTKNEVRS